jgi:hypothetical protein
MKLRYVCTVKSYVIVQSCLLKHIVQYLFKVQRISDTSIRNVGAGVIQWQLSHGCGLHNCGIGFHFPVGTGGFSLLHTLALELPQPPI